MLSSNIITLVLMTLVLMPAFIYAHTPSNDNSTYIMIGNSMSPSIRDNDGMIVDSRFPFDKLNVGDIIVFNSYGTSNLRQKMLAVGSHLRCLQPSMSTMYRLSKLGQCSCRCL